MDQVEGSVAASHGFDEAVRIQDIALGHLDLRTPGISIQLPGISGQRPDLVTFG